MGCLFPPLVFSFPHLWHFHHHHHHDHHHQQHHHNHQLVRHSSNVISLPTFQIPFDTSLFPTSLNSSLSGSTSDCESEPPPPCPPWGWREEAACPPWGWRGDGQAGFACFLQVLRLSDERRLKSIHASSDHLHPLNKTLEHPATWNKCLCPGIAPESWWSQ